MLVGELVVQDSGLKMVMCIGWAALGRCAGWRADWSVGWCLWSAVMLMLSKLVFSLAVGKFNKDGLGAVLVTCASWMAGPLAVLQTSSDVGGLLVTYLRWNSSGMGGLWVAALDATIGR